MQKVVKGKILNEFLISVGKEELSAPDKQGKVGEEFRIVGVSNNYVIVKFEENGVDYFIHENEFENIKFFKAKI